MAEIPPLLVLLPETRQNVEQDQAPDKQELPMRFDLSEAWNGVNDRFLARILSPQLKSTHEGFN